MFDRNNNFIKKAKQFSLVWKGVAASLCLLIVAFVWITYVYLPMHRTLHSVQSQLAYLYNEVEEFKSASSGADGNLDLNSGELFSPYADSLNFVLNKFKESGLKCQKVVRDEIKKNKDVEKYYITIHSRGSYSSLLSLLDTISRSSRGVKLKGMEIGEGSDEHLRVALKMCISCYESSYDRLYKDKK